MSGSWPSCRPALGSAPLAEGPSSATDPAACRVWLRQNVPLELRQRTLPLAFSAHSHARAIAHLAPWLDTSAPGLPGRRPSLPNALSLTRPPRPDPKPEGLVSLPRGHSLCKGSAQHPRLPKPACSLAPQILFPHELPPVAAAWSLPPGSPGCPQGLLVFLRLLLPSPGRGLHYLGPQAVVIGLATWRSYGEASPGRG